MTRRPRGRCTSLCPRVDPAAVSATIAPDERTRNVEKPERANGYPTRVSGATFLFIAKESPPVDRVKISVWSATMPSGSGELAEHCYRRPLPTHAAVPIDRQRVSAAIASSSAAARFHIADRRPWLRRTRRVVRPASTEVDQKHLAADGAGGHPGHGARQAHEGHHTRCVAGHATALGGARLRWALARYARRRCSRPCPEASLGASFANA